MSQTLEHAAAARFISNLWCNEIDHDGLELLTSEDCSRFYQALGGYVPTANCAQTLEQLSIEFCETFIGPKNHFPPVQSVWENDQFQSESTSSMRQFLDLLADFEPKLNLLDHLGVQLDFVAELIQMPDQNSVRDVIAQFGSQHLEWSRSYLTIVQQRAESSFYRGLAQVTYGFVDDIRSVYP